MIRQEQKRMTSRHENPLRAFSYGGGVQSTAALALAGQGLLDWQIFLFANVGDDSEHPETLRYVREIAMPYARAHGIELHELHKVTRTGEPVTLYSNLTKPNSRSIGIPVRMNTSGVPGRRSCTADFKIAVIDKWLREHGAKQTGAIVGLGISLDEYDRASDNKDPDTIAWKTNTFPLLYELPKALDRQQCMNIIRQAGLPVPPKSACWFCPYHRLARWQEMRKSEPALFWKAADLEALLNKRRAALGMDEVWLTRKLIPLAQATTELEQESWIEEEDNLCDSGHCML